MFASSLHPPGRPLHAAWLDVHQEWRACSHQPAKMFGISTGCESRPVTECGHGGTELYAAYVFFESSIANMQQVDHCKWVRYLHFSFLPYLLKALTTPMNLSANCKQSMNWEEVCSGTLHIQPQKAKQITMSMRNPRDSRICNYISFASVYNHSIIIS